MKTVGTLNSGEHLVSLSREEHQEFLLAQQAIQNESAYWRAIEPSRHIDTDFQHFFFAMRIFVEAKFKADELEAMAQGLQATIGIK